jgi:hypothetical protein
MNEHERIEYGADQCIMLVSELAKGQPDEAIRMLLVAAIALAKATGMSSAMFVLAFKDAWMKTDVTHENVQ